MFYRIVWEQLSFVKSLKILDFGSGFGITASHMAADNHVVAIEPDRCMCDMRIKENDYIQINGDIEKLKEFNDENFDLIFCHNVFEYVENKDAHMRAFTRLLKSGGKLSLIKHNHFGRIMQRIAHDNDLKTAMGLLNGEPAYAQNFGEIRYYDLSDIINWQQAYKYRQAENYGIRTFFALNSDDIIKSDENWLDSMFELEIKASRIAEFRNIAFFNHLILQKM